MKELMRIFEGEIVKELQRLDKEVDEVRVMFKDLNPEIKTAALVKIMQSKIRYRVNLKQVLLKILVENESITQNIKPKLIQQREISIETDKLLLDNLKNTIIPKIDQINNTAGSMWRHYKNRKGIKGVL